MIKSNKEYFQKCCLCVVSSTCILASRNQTSYPSQARIYSVYQKSITGIKREKVEHCTIPSRFRFYMAMESVVH